MVNFTPSGVERTVAETPTYDAFPCAVGLPDGSLLALWRRSTEHVGAGEALALAARSEDEGVTWSAPILVSDTVGQDDAPTGVVAWPDGEIVAQILTTTTGMSRTSWVTRSLDGGQTWGPLEPGVQPTGSGKYAAGLTLYNNGTRDGVLYATHYVTGAFVARSLDRGRSWEPQVQIVANGDRVWQEPQIAALANGELVCMLRSYRASDSADDALYLSRSFDEGQTWSTPERKIAGASGQPTVAAAPDDTLLLIYRDPPLPEGDFAWATSANRGEQWTVQDASPLGAPKMMYGGWALLPSGDAVCIYARETTGTDSDVFAQLFATDSVTPEPPPPLPVPSASAGVARTHVTWLACDLVTGQILSELPEVRGQIGRVLGAYTSTSLTLPIPLAGPGALGDAAFEATIPGVRMLVAVVNDVPSWGGIILTRQGGTDATLNFGCVTLEGYLDRRYVGDHVWLGVDQASVIAAGLIADANVDGIDLVVDAPDSGTSRWRRYYDYHDATVYQRLRELAGVQGGPEWTIDLEWADASQTHIAKVIRVHDRIGTASATPNAVFEARSNSETTYTYAEDYTGERGANDVMATGSGEGEDRPRSSHHRDVRPGWPVYERRFSPNTGSEEDDVLDDHAAAELELMVAGANTWTIASRWDKPPRLNLDWALGDDVAWELVGHRHPGEGARGHGRAIGWNLNLQTGIVEPVLWSPTEEAT